MEVDGMATWMEDGFPLQTGLFSTYMLVSRSGSYLSSFHATHFLRVSHRYCPVFSQPMIETYEADLSN